MAAQHEVIGGRKFRKTLRAAGDDLKNLKDVHGQAAGIAAEGARSRVPVRTGRLRKTIRSSGTKTAGIVRVGNNTKVAYAPVIHWGWAARQIAANPFASKGAQQTEPQWLFLYLRYTDSALDQIKGK